MDIGLEMLNTLIPSDECWVLMHDGDYARYGTSNENIGVLAFASKAKADEFIGAIATGYEVVRMDKWDLVELAYNYDECGKICFAAAASEDAPGFVFVLRLAEADQDDSEEDNEEKECLLPTSDVNWLGEGF